MHHINVVIMGLLTIGIQISYEYKLFLHCLLIVGTRQLQTIETAELEWRDGAPVACRYGDIYFSAADGLAETQSVFIKGNDLELRWQQRPERFLIAETGFGSGLNFLVACDIWLQQSHPGQCLQYTAVEKYPLSKSDLRQAISLFPGMVELLESFLSLYPPSVHGFHRLNLFNNRVQLTLAYMDVEEWLASICLQADAWFLDGFAPSTNPEMWAADNLQLIANNTAPGGSFATFTAAGSVRRGLEKAGFRVEKIAGFGQKRERLQGHYEPAVNAESKYTAKEQPWFIVPRVNSAIVAADKKTVTIIGAGLAGIFFCSESCPPRLVR